MRINQLCLVCGWSCTVSIVYPLSDKAEVSCWQTQLLRYRNNSRDCIVSDSDVTRCVRAECLLTLESLKTAHDFLHVTHQNITSITRGRHGSFCALLFFLISALGLRVLPRIVAFTWVLLNEVISLRGLCCVYAYILNRILKTSRTDHYVESGFPMRVIVLWIRGMNMSMLTLSHFGSDSTHTSHWIQLPSGTEGENRFPQPLSPFSSLSLCLLLLLRSFMKQGRNISQFFQHPKTFFSTHFPNK